jgi:prepilin-type N-terminal cleavage/methylation domain-containing protein
MKEQNGFTIYELVSVMGIIAILALIVTPNMMAWRSKAKLRGASNTLKADLQMAKLRALRENTIVAVIFKSNGYNIFIDNGAGGNTGNWIRDGDESLVLNRQIPAGISIALPTTFDPPYDRTRFNGRGLPDAATLAGGGGLTGTVKLHNVKGSQRQITLNRLGRFNET